jgi:hypothetical protein
MLSTLSIISNHLFLFDRAQKDLGDGYDSISDNKHLNDLFIINVVLSCIGMVGYMCVIVGGIKFYQLLVITNTVIIPMAFIVQIILSLQTANDIEEFDYTFINAAGPLVGVVMIHQEKV